MPCIHSPGDLMSLPGTPLVFVCRASSHRSLVPARSELVPRRLCLAF